MRSLTKTEQGRLAFLTSKSIAVTLIQSTGNGLKKSIMDATAPVRLFLKNNGVHDYGIQSQGPENKVKVESYLVREWSMDKSVASLYRPHTKKGDPRIWFTGLKNYAKADDILAMMVFEEKLYVINLTQLPVVEFVEGILATPLKEVVEQLSYNVNAVAIELLNKLKSLAHQGFISSPVDADTAVGRVLESALGIQINCSKKPDYKGIELKAFRERRTNRKNLFAQVADWDLSKLKSSEEILEHFGYKRGNEFKLYCTVSTIKKNSQGLIFRMDNNLAQLVENSIDIGDFAVWRLEKLHARLLEKHNETFWIAAETKRIDGVECFRYNKVEHTYKPIVSQFDVLLEQGMITMDHVIKRSQGKVCEKGPLFKIHPQSLNLLFPPSKVYDLLG